MSIVDRTVGRLPDSPGKNSFLSHVGSVSTSMLYQVAGRRYWHLAINGFLMSSWLHSLIRSTPSVRQWFSGHESNVIATIMALLIAPGVLKLINGIRVCLSWLQVFKGTLCLKSGGELHVKNASPLSAVGRTGCALANDMVEP